MCESKKFFDLLKIKISNDVTDIQSHPEKAPKGIILGEHLKKLIIKFEKLEASGTPDSKMRTFKNLIKDFVDNAIININNENITTNVFNDLTEKDYDLKF